MVLHRLDRKYLSDVIGRWTLPAIDLICQERCAQDAIVAWMICVDNCFLIGVEFSSQGTFILVTINMFKNPFLVRSQILWEVTTIICLLYGNIFNLLSTYIYTQISALFSTFIKDNSV